MKGDQPFIFICIARLDRAGDCAEQRRGNIIPAALPCRMKPFILYGACQKRSFDAQPMRGSRAWSTQATSSPHWFFFYPAYRMT